MRFITIFLVVLFSSFLQAQSSQIVQFKNGEIADADDINSNFNYLDDRVQALEAGNSVSTVCSQSDIDGRWSIFLHSSFEGTSLKCDAYFNESQYDSNNSNCIIYDGMNERGVYVLNNAEFTVKSNCQIDFSISGDSKSNEITEIGYAIMTSDHKGIMGFLRNVEEDLYTTINGIKLD